ncbi:MAG: endonuclease/exonuclease/phosphatase family protein [Acidimicrobiia bacterium]|nr:endonuclease/exonuclease/phosphatase family protein [Acidimicrobiia bacterium]
MSDVMWGVVGALDLLVLALLLNISWFAWLAVFHDGSPVVLTASWIPLIYGIATGHWAIAIAASLLAGIHLGLVVPRLMKDPVPPWVASAPRTRLAVANVFLDNRTPAAAAAQLVATNAEVIVVTERTDLFIAAFEAADRDGRYATKIDKPPERADYALAIAARVPLLDGSTVLNLESLRLVTAVVACGDQRVTIVGVHLAALTERHGFGIWRTETAELTEFLAGLTPPFVVVGDFNATRFRPAFRQLLRSLHLTEAHDAAGRGLSGSLKLAARGALGVFPAFARVDHALLSRGVHATKVVNLPPAGSDHLPFVVTIAVEPARVSDATSAGIPSSPAE